MVAFAKEESLSVVAVKSKHLKNGVYVVLVPDGLRAEEIDAALRKMGLDPTRVYPLENWTESANGLCVAFLPHLGSD